MSETQQNALRGVGTIQTEASRSEGFLTVPAVHGWGWSIAARAVFIYSINVLLWEPFHLDIHIVWDLGLPLFSRYFKLMGPEWIGSTYNLVVSLLIGSLWFMVDRRRKHETAIQELARLASRYSLAGMLAQYGLEKLIGSQGSWALYPSWLIRPLGEAGTGAAMMSWLSFSTVYEQFSGWVEMGAGLLIFARRTTTLAAFLTVASMLNVMVINFSYFGRGTVQSPAIWLPQSMFLIAPYMGRFLNFFVLNRPTTMRVEYLDRPFWVRRASLFLKVVMIPLVLYGPLAENIAMARIIAQHSPLGGNYRVESFERNGEAEPLSYEFPARWREVAIDPLAEQIVARTVDGTDLAITAGWPTEPLFPTMVEPQVSIEQAKRLASSEGNLHIISVSATRRGAAVGNLAGAPHAVLHYTWVGPSELLLSGDLNGVALKIQLQKLPADQIPFFLHRWKPF